MAISFYQWAWIAVAWQVLLLILWLYNVYGAGPGRNDAAGKGLAKLFILALLAYIFIETVLLLFRNKYCTAAVLCMTVLPLTITAAGLIRHLRTRKR